MQAQRERQSYILRACKVGSPWCLCKSVVWEREFEVDSGASMHMVSEKDLNSAELATMRTSRSPTTVMTANGELRTNKEATIYVKQLDIFVKVMLLQETPQCFHWGNSAMNMGIRITGKAVRIYISSRMARGLIAIYQTMYHLSWNLNKFFLNYAFICLVTIFITGVCQQ